MYEIGQFAVVGDGEQASAGLLPIRLSPFTHYAAYPWWSETTKAMLESLPDLVRPGMTVLDFGCGASAILSIAVAVLGATPVPVEIHPELADIASEQLAHAGVIAPVMHEPLAIAYDVVLANVGDALLVGQVSNRAPHGIGTGAEGEVIRW